VDRGGALAGVRVLDWTDETGRLAGKLLAEAGADVLRLRRGTPGPRMTGDAAARGGVLDWWYDGGTSYLPLDLEAPAGRALLYRLAARADLLIETAGPAQPAAALGLSAGAVRAANPGLVHVSLTPYGLAGPRAEYRASDLVAAALGGVLAVSGTAEAPLAAWGRQCCNVGGFYAALAGLAGLRQAQLTGRGAHFDLSLVQAVASCTEQLLMYWFHRDWFPDGLAPRQGSLHWTGLYEVMPCESGHVMLAVAPDLRSFFSWMIAADAAVGALAESPPATAAEAFRRAREIMAAARRWASREDARTFAAEAQRRNLAFGEVRDLSAAADCPQLAARGFLREVSWDGPPLRVPHPLFRLSLDPAPPPTPPPARPLSFEEALARWPERRPPASTVSPSESRPPPEREAGTAALPGPAYGRKGAAGALPAKPLAGLRVLDFTWVLAGPFATRLLADLGADVVKIQTEALSQGANSNEFPFFLMWNRGKRGITLDMRHARAVETFRRLVERSDVVIDNFSFGVLDRLGIGYAMSREWNPAVIYVSMAGCGAQGPWRDHLTYAPTIHALCGLTDLTNPEGRRDVGLGVSLSDHVSGLAAALAVLEAIEARRRTGEGQHVDLSQLEVGAYLIGPAYIETLAGGESPRAGGNRDPFDDPVPNEVYRCREGGWIAVTARDDSEWRALCAAIGDAALASEPALATVDGRRRERPTIDRRVAAWAATVDALAAMRQLQAAGVAAGQLQGAPELAADEQLRSRRWLAELAHASLERQTVDRFPALIDGQVVDPPRASPTLGEHNFEVYGELLGLTEAEIAEAIADGLFS
jgi:crotonobetainyl-CoA:carnitine CoA-transferase CaiB-like acyl-CoA transferase